MTYPMARGLGRALSSWHEREQNGGWAMDDVTNLYLYRTHGRDDRMEFAVGANFRDGRKDSAVALFQTRHAAMVFMQAMSTGYGMAVQVLPSAEV